MTDDPILAANPRLSSWLRVLPDGVVEVRTGRVELGQGVLTAMAQVAAEELDVHPARIRMTPATTGCSPNEGYTAGSLSIQHGAAALRVACAQARGLYLAAAAEQLGADAGALTVTDGEIMAPDGGATSYWDLPELPEVGITGEYPAKSPSRYRLVGTSAPRLDLPDKVTGRPRYVHDLTLPGQCYAQVVRPPSRGATLADLDEKPASALAGVIAIVRDGDFLAVIAERIEVARSAARLLRSSARWNQRPTLPDPDDLPGYLRSAPAETTVLATRGSPSPEISREAVYHRPYLAHASIGTCSATALFFRESGRLRVWSHTQGVYPLRAELARALALDPEMITVTHVEGAGCYGHNGADDVALDAAMAARAVPGRPVQVTWSRADELGWAPFGGAGVIRVAASVDGSGNVRSWRHEIWSNGFTTRPGSVESVSLLAASHVKGGSPIDPAAEPPLAAGAGAARNAVPYYDFPAYEVVNHRLLEMPLRTSALRSLGAFGNVFAAESFLDELAAAAGRDPVEYRLSMLGDPRARAVVSSAASRSSWGTPMPDSHGRGIGFARYKNTSAYCAVVAEVEAISEIRVRRLTIAVDAGLIVNPDGAVNQIEGGAIQATSWAVKEQVRFDRYGVTSDTWETYPILRFSEVPAVDVALMPAEGNPSLGVGECAQGPVAAAIANAIYHALSVRVRALPFTPENIAAALLADCSRVCEATSPHPKKRHRRVGTWRGTAERLSRTTTVRRCSFQQADPAYRSGTTCFLGSHPRANFRGGIRPRTATGTHAAVPLAGRPSGDPAAYRAEQPRHPCSSSTAAPASSGTCPPRSSARYAPREAATSSC